MAKGEEIAQALLDRGAVIIRPKEPFRFASGILSPIYCDNRLLLSDLSKRERVVEGLSELAKELNPEYVAGTATAGIAWGAWVADRLKAPFAYVRAEAKAHGEGKRIEGEIKTGAKGVLVEDLISTGGSVLSAAEAITKAGATVKGIVAIFTYDFPETAPLFKAKGIALRTLVNLDQMLSAATNLQKISSEERAAVEKWRGNPKSWSVV